VAISLLLCEISGVRDWRLEQAKGIEHAFRAIMPRLRFLPVGIVLLLPLFFVGQCALGRKICLTLGEMLWCCAWLINVLFVMYITVASVMVGVHPYPRPSFLLPYLCLHGPISLGALVVLYRDFSHSRPVPWTHRFGVVLLSWTAIPLAIMFSAKIMLQ
jgi:hypothetical protein